MAYTIKIDLESQTPVYKQLINSVETAIHNGEYRYGDLLPSMNELSLQLGISKETVKKAYSLMRDRGVISATQGKGFYVSSENSGQNPKILVLFDKLSTYKQVLFSSFSSTIGTRGEITIRLHNQQIDLLEYYIDENLDQFDYYVVTPHFPLDESTQRRAVKALMRIPNRKLILLDRCLDSLPGNYGVVYQDFTNDVYEGLMQALKKLRKQNRLNIITEASSLYYTFIREGAENAMLTTSVSVRSSSHGSSATSPTSRKNAPLSFWYTLPCKAGNSPIRSITATVPPCWRCWTDMPACRSSPDIRTATAWRLLRVE